MTSTPSNRLRVAYPGALADALLALAHATSRALAHVIEAMSGQTAHNAEAVTTSIDDIKARARALERAAVLVMWEEQPAGRELEIVLTIHRLATDYRRLADDLAALATDLLLPHRPTPATTSPFLRALAEAALRSSSYIHEGLHDGTARPLLRASTESAITETLIVEGITELKRSLLTRSVTATCACSLLAIVMALHRIIRQTAATACHCRAFLAQTA